MRVVDVAPDMTAPGVASSYTYLLPEGTEAQRGDAVLIPFGPRTVVGYVLEVRDTAPEDLGFDPAGLKEIQSVIDGLSLPGSLMTTLRFLSEQYLTPFGAAVASAMPPGVRSRLSTTYRAIGKDEEGLTRAQREALCMVREMGGQITESKRRRTGRAAGSALRALVSKGLLERTVSLPPERHPSPRLLRLGDPEQIESFLASEAKRRPAQAACLLALRDTPDARLTSGEVRAIAGVTTTIVTKLAQAGLLVESEPDLPKPAPAPKRLTGKQSAAVKRIVASIRRADGRRFLLHGVTGSGKTEVYLRAVAETLAGGRQALYLVPEIALTAQVITQLRDRFGPDIALMHSGLAEGERLRHWRRARSGEAPVVLGARSAIFAPLANLGLVVVDEEHEGTYKQDSAPRYRLRELAEFRAKQSSATLVLGSATPSVESFHRADGGDIELLTLPRRATEAELPDVTVIDLRELFRARQPAILGPELSDALSETLASGAQAMLFINRRAFASALLCRDCGFVPKCESCSVSLTLHRRARRLRCHHCGYNRPALDSCPACESPRLRPLGLGTEKVEEVAREQFPEARIGRLDRDTARRRGAIETILAQLREGELDVLVGTQMIAKGLDFPNVSLVGVVTADTGLNVPDFRSTERTFQLLTQMAGRAGRHRPGRVIIQTFQPNHPAVQFAAAQDYDAFYRAEIVERKEARYPPYVRLVNIVASSADRDGAEGAIRKAAEFLQDRPDLVVVGPAECPFERLHGRWRYHLLVKLPPGGDPEVVRLPRDLLVSRDAQVIVDVDPMSLL
ncbi:MAG: primosomal protein N' [Armatimonadetes bacterium]|nr:primosomal protein N' [Armatimonadota bacterium]